MTHYKATITSQRYYAISKRLVDLTLSLIGLLVLSPLLAAIALLIKLDSPGPVLFIQKRIGMGGRPFRIIKFRTMEHRLNDAKHRAFMRAFIRGEIGSAQTQTGECSPEDSDLQNQPQPSTEGPTGDKQAIFKPFQKSQVTRIGRILRKTSLDELPQVLNVLAGNMSLVGPRPNVPWEVEEYQDWHRERLAVLPGITGLAQVNGRSAIDFGTIVRYDVEYVRSRNLWLDLRILAQTVFQVLIGHGAH